MHGSLFRFSMYSEFDALLSHVLNVEISTKYAPAALAGACFSECLDQQ